MSQVKESLQILRHESDSIADRVHYEVPYRVVRIVYATQNAVEAPARSVAAIDLRFDELGGEDGTDFLPVNWHELDNVSAFLASKMMLHLV